MKYIDDIPYIIYAFKSNTMWAWHDGVYGVHPDYIKEFILHILKLRDGVNKEQDVLSRHL
jgi:hypothetical protein